MNYDSHELPQQFSARDMYEVTAQSVSSRMTIGLYVPTAVEYLPYNSVSRRVAKSIADIIVRDKDNLTVEHIGSTAVPGCWGKGISELAASSTAGGIIGCTRISSNREPSKRSASFDSAIYCARTRS